VPWQQTTRSALCVHRSSIVLWSHTPPLCVTFSTTVSPWAKASAFFRLGQSELQHAYHLMFARYGLIVVEPWGLLSRWEVCFGEVVPLYYCSSAHDSEHAVRHIQILWSTHNVHVVSWLGNALGPC
jgi:hypothetical protein